MAEENSPTISKETQLEGITYEATLTKCQEVERILAYMGDTPSAINELNPLGALYLNFKWPLDKFNFDKITTGILAPPAHGKVTPEIVGSYLYEANIDANGQPYSGPDTVVFWVQIEGKYYKVVQNLAVIPVVYGQEPSACTTMKFEVLKTKL